MGADAEVGGELRQDGLRRVEIEEGRGAGEHDGKAAAVGEHEGAPQERLEA